MVALLSDKVCVPVVLTEVPGCTSTGEVSASAVEVAAAIVAAVGALAAVASASAATSAAAFLALVEQLQCRLLAGRVALRVGLFRDNAENLARDKEDGHMSSK